MEMTMSEIEKIMEEGEERRLKAERAVKLMVIFYKDRENVDWDSLLETMFNQVKGICGSCGKSGEECVGCLYHDKILRG